MASGNYRLTANSPCIDAGADLSGFGMRVWSYETGGWVDVFTISKPTDILGNTRFIDGNGDGKVAWDIGAYEFNSFKPPRFTAPPESVVDGWKLNVTAPTNKWVRVERSTISRIGGRFGRGR